MGIISALWKKIPGEWGCICTKSKLRPFSNHFFKRPFDDVDEFIRRNTDKDLWFCVHLMTRKIRQKEYAVRPKLLWADLDEVDPRKCKIKPTIAFESSPGRYVGLWMIDKPMTEDLNKRLTYFLGADKGGWDLSQVLRIPGTINYKYASMPRVRVLWDDGPKWKAEELERRLPRLSKKVGEGESDAKAIYDKFEKDLPKEVLRLMNSTPDRHSDRSAALWKIERSLIEAGATREEAFTYCRASPWNKFKDRHNGDEQLKHELNKGIDEKLEEVVNGEDYVPFSKSMAEVEEENIEWLWYPYLARGEVTIVEGDPGVGKSYAVQMIAKSICDGERLPSPKPRKVMGKVFFADLENSASTVTKKRLKFNECRHMENFFQEEEPFVIDDEKFMMKLYDVLEDQRPLLIVFDTVNLYIGKADTGKASETTQALAIFKEMAKRFNCAVVVVRHLTKSGSNTTKALYRGQGNIAFAGVSRILITIGQDPEDPETKVLAVTKINLAQAPRALTFTIEGLADTLRESDRSKFSWGDYVDLSSEDIIRTSIASGAKATEEAEAFLRDRLGDGPVEGAEILQMAETQNISKRTLYRAATKLGIDHKVRGTGDKRSTWVLPDDLANRDKTSR